MSAPSSHLTLKGPLSIRKPTPISLCLGQPSTPSQANHSLLHPSILSSTAFGTSRLTLLLPLLHVAAASQQLLSLTTMMMHRSACYNYRSYRS